MEELKSKSATKAKNKYNSQNYDNLRIVVPKGRKSEIFEAAKKAGDSLNGFVIQAIYERIVSEWHQTAKKYTIISGVNGVGKSSFSGVLAFQNNALGDIVDSAKITAAKKVFPNEGSKIALRCITEHLENGRSFAEETALIGKNVQLSAEKAKELGYYIRLYYIGLNTPEECLKRISNRATRGGHDIGEIDVRRRFAERWKSLNRILPYCDEAVFFDNDNGFVEVAEYADKKLIIKEDIHPLWIAELAEYLKKRR